MSNVERYVKLHAWIANQKDALETEGSSIAALQRAAAEELGFKPAAKIVKDTLDTAGVEMKRTRSGGGNQAEVAALREKCDYLLHLCVDLAEAGMFSTNFVTDLCREEDIPSEIVDALKAE